ncbi:L-arabinose isomerase [Botrimarina sp.]|uniref:L-arabinose isomerase n=1 Tax=Botrimarina sp. TaxID=2795802 RepID=UPI0032EB4A45
MPLPDLGDYEVWFVTGSQHLYGSEALDRVAADAREVAAALGASHHVPVRVVWKPTVTRPDDVLATLQAANSDPKCVGVAAWMHTFSPAKMWIAGLRALRKPLLHLHTQHGREIPWSAIDMDFMNLHQSAHGGREFGFACTRLGVERKVVVGHWSDDAVHQRVGAWARAAAGRHELARARIARLGDNMREVAVTEGDKVAAQEVLGVAVDGYGVGELAARVDAASDADVDRLCSDYDHAYQLAEPLRPGGDRRGSLRDAARIELGLRGFLTEGGFAGFTDTFEDLVGIKQLPGIAAQRLMADGYGFGAEGDWKAAAMVRASKVMAAGLPGGVSFMEDYTYHLPESGGDLVLGAHMLEVCPTIAAGRPRCEVHPLGIGGKEDPVRLVFDAAPGPAVNATLIDLGDRFRMIVNQVEAIAPPHELPKLPVARAVWKPAPDLATAAAAWIYAGGSHHPVYSPALTVEHYEDLAAMVGVELIVIDESTDLRTLRQSLRRSSLRRV